MRWILSSKSIRLQIWSFKSNIDGTVTCNGTKNNKSKAQSIAVAAMGGWGHDIVLQGAAASLLSLHYSFYCLKVRNSQKLDLVSNKGPLVCAKHCVCSSWRPGAWSSGAFYSGKVQPGQIARKAGCRLSFRRCAVCEPGLDTYCQRAAAFDPHPKTLTRAHTPTPPPPFTAANRTPAVPTDHRPDGCLIKEAGGHTVGLIADTASEVELRRAPFCADMWT